ncbi:SDR family oxidoreductase [Streptomyces sp. NPDC052052]|uniref:SDR family NAD(P)-dependent oxidoreductase n=1 Tax=Streptomyces sp. NPDC052052 TaxID=3154756 RepID=UPI00342D793D
MDIDLSGRVALVTGGLGGIGAATVRVLVEAGATVALTYAQGVETAEGAQPLLALAPDRMSAHPLDLRSGESIDRCLGEVEERWGRVDILINNAAVGSATVERFSDNVADQDATMLMINANGTLLMSRRFIETVMRQPSDNGAAKLINLSSVGGGVSAFPNFRLSDGMSKAAVAFLTRQLAAEHTGSHLDVFAVCPGATNTGMFQSSTLDHLGADERRDFLYALPKHRLIEPEEVARVLLFLASAHSTVLHGAVIDASMGLGVRPGILTEGSG